VDQTPEVWRQRLTTVVAYVITVAWATSFLVDIVSESYTPHPSITPLMLFVAGFCFKEGIVPDKSKSSKEKQRGK